MSGGGEAEGVIQTLRLVVPAHSTFAWGPQSLEIEAANHTLGTCLDSGNPGLEW